LSALRKVASTTTVIATFAPVSLSKSVKLDSQVTVVTSNSSNLSVFLSTLLGSTTVTAYAGKIVGFDDPDLGWDDGFYDVDLAILSVLTAFNATASAESTFTGEVKLSKALNSIISSTSTATSASTAIKVLRQIASTVTVTATTLTTGAF
jgi:hypothetical protein